jgi:nucleoside-diphosphate-sugar epimerase
LCKSVNITGTENIINAAKKQPKPPWVLFISSREVYGQSAKLPVTEISPIQPCNIYGLSKAEAEKLIWQNRNRGFQSAILRFTNLYGSINDHPDRLIPTLVRKALLGETIYIDGEHRIFDFLHIEDAINGVLSTIAKLESEEYNLPTIQLVSGYAVSLSNLAEQIKKVTNSCSAICKRDAHKHDVTEFYGDSSLAYKFLRWSASIGLEDGLSRLANDFNKSFLMPSSIVTTHSNRTTNNQVTNSPIILDL